MGGGERVALCAFLVFIGEIFFRLLSALFTPCVSLKPSKCSSSFISSSKLEVGMRENAFGTWISYFIPPSRLGYIKDSHTRDSLYWVCVCVCGWQRGWRMCHGKNHIDLFVCSSLEMARGRARTSLARPKPLEFTVLLLLCCWEHGI